ncbi:MAG: hypothetical protein HY819_04195 [Acidobacteria bacterium]|nr:hypothetical protein [Acidobacteriota bacterium]
MAQQEKNNQSSAIWTILRTSIIGRAINVLAGPFVDAQILNVIQEYFPKARLITHTRTDILHIETRLSHVTNKFVHTTFSVILKDPQIDELCLAMEVGGYKALIFGFTPVKVLWFLRAKDFYLLNTEAWENYHLCLDNTEIGELLIPEVEVSQPLD